MALHTIVGFLSLFTMLGATPPEDIQAKLDKLVSFEKGLDSMRLGDALKRLADENKLTFVIEKQQFDFGDRVDVADLQVRLPKILSTRLATIMRLLLSQVDASFEVRNGRIVVVPMSKTKVLEPKTPERAAREKQLMERLAQLVDVEKGIDARTPFGLAMEFFSDRYDMIILTDTGGFRRVLNKEVETSFIQLPPRLNVPLYLVLDEIVAQVDGAIEIIDTAVLIVPTASPRR